MRALRVSVFLVGAAFAASGTAFAQNAKVDRGQKIFVEQKCSVCHSVAGKGNKKGPLDEVGSKLKAEEIHQWLTEPEAMAAKAKSTRKPAMKSYAKKLPKEDIDALVAYLQTLKKP